MIESFQLRHVEEKLYVIVVINGVTYEKDVTEYFESHNDHDKWLDYHLDI